MDSGYDDAMADANRGICGDIRVLVRIRGQVEAESIRAATSDAN